MPPALNWLQTAQACFSDDYGSLQRGLLTSVFGLVIGLERIFHLDEMADCQATIIFPDQRQSEFPIALAPSKGSTTITFPDPDDSRACRLVPFPVTFSAPGETESGSAGTQPDKG
jgi:hypothetical protein